MRKGGRSRLSDVERENIVRCWKAGDVIPVICKKFNVSPATVSRLVSGMERENPSESLDETLE